MTLLLTKIIQSPGQVLSARESRLYLPWTSGNAGVRRMRKVQWKVRSS